MNRDDIKAGTAYVFRWASAPSGELTGMCVTSYRKLLTLRTASGTAFTVPPEDVLREAPPVKKT